MAERKSYATRLNEFETQVFQIAAQVWPEHTDNTSELIRAILADWRRLREDSTSQRLTEIESILTKINEKIDALLKTS